MKQDTSLDAVGKTQRALTILLLDVAQKLDQLQHTDQNINQASAVKCMMENLATDHPDEKPTLFNFLLNVFPSCFHIYDLSS